MLFFLVLHFLFVNANINVKILQNFGTDNTPNINSTLLNGLGRKPVYFGLNDGPNDRVYIMAKFFLHNNLIHIVSVITYFVILLAILYFPVFGLTIITCSLFYLCSYL